jgi:hypothetical protein
MKNELENIKNELSELMIRVDGLMAKQSEQGEFSFTKEQLIDFAKVLIDKTVETIHEQLRDINLDEDVVELEMSYDRCIEVSIDQRMVADAARDTIDINTDDDDVVFEQIETTLKNIGIKD